MGHDLELVIAANGLPALILQGASTVDPDTKSGNPRHEVGTGKFGTGPGKTDRRQQQDRRGPLRRQADVDNPSALRRRDAVVDAARQIADLDDEQEVRRFMRQRWSGTRVMTELDVQSFINDARRQRIQDVIDTLDNRVRAGVLKRAKVVNIHFPRGWVKSTMNGLSDQEVLSVLDRLRSRGWTEQQVRQHVVQRFDDEHKRLARLRGNAEAD